MVVELTLFIQDKLAPLDRLWRELSSLVSQ